MNNPHPALFYGTSVSECPHVLVACMGKDFLPGTYESIQEAVKTATAQGITVTTTAIHDLCITPFHGLGAMRNIAILRAFEYSATHVLIIDNDIKLSDPLTIVELVRADKLVVTPWFDQTPCEKGKGLWQLIQEPLPKPQQGLVLLNWVAVNCILFDLTLFRLLGPRLFTDPMISNEEDYIFTYLRHYGVRLWQHTNVIVEMLRPPTKMWEVIPGGRLRNKPTSEEMSLI